MAWIGFCAITITCQGGNHIAIEEVCFDQGSHCIKILVESNLAFTKIESGNSDAESKKWVVLSENDIAGIYPCTGIDVAALLSSLVTTACSRNSNVALSWSVQFDNDMNFSSTVFSSNIANLRSHTFHIIFDLTTLKPHEQCRYDTFRDYNGNYSVQKSSTYNLSSISFRPHKPLEPSSPSQPLICISQTTTANTTAAATRAATQALARLWAWIDPCSETRRVIHVNTVSVSTIRRRVQHNGHSITTLFAQVQCPLVSSKTEQSITYEVTSSVGEFTATDGCSCLPLELMQHSMRWLDARGLRAMASTCRSLRLLADLLVPGLRLQLYPHQVDSVRWMASRERNLTMYPHPAWRTLSLQQSPLDVSASPDPLSSLPQGQWSCNVITGELIELSSSSITLAQIPSLHGVSGGFLCDEPGLGKTITLLALILRQLGTKAAPDDMRSEVSIAGAVKSQSHSMLVHGRSGLRHAEWRGGPRADAPRALPSGASLIVVPEVLLGQWRDQIDRHVSPAVLRAGAIYFDAMVNGVAGTVAPLPPAEQLACYTIIVVSHKRLAHEWRTGRPLSIADMRPARFGDDQPEHQNDCGNEFKTRMASFERLRAIHKVSPLLGLVFVRVCFDEGHSLGRAGALQQESSLMACCLLSRSRWLLTGTPAPSDTAMALQHIRQQLSFLDHPLLRPPHGERMWRALMQPVIRPKFNGDQVFGAAALLPLLRQCMVRHSKDSLPNIPRPVYSEHGVKLSAKEVDVYNFFASVAMTNLVITDFDYSSPGSGHKDSLLNGKNRDALKELVTNLRLATCGVGRSRLVLANEATALAQLEAALVSRACNEIDITKVRRFIYRSLSGESTACELCKIKLELLVVTPCRGAHLYCASCLRANKDYCKLCDLRFDWNDLQRLQPGFSAGPFVSSQNSNNNLVDGPGERQGQLLDNGYSPVISDDMPSAKINFLMQKIEHLQSGENYGMLPSSMLPMSEMACVGSIPTSPASKLQVHVNSTLPKVSKRGLSPSPHRKVSFAATPRYSDEADDIHMVIADKTNIEIFLERTILNGDVESDLLPLKVRRLVSNELAADRRSFNRTSRICREASMQPPNQTTVKLKLVPPQAKVVVFSEFPLILTRVSLELRARKISFCQLQTKARENGAGSRLRLAIERERELMRFKTMPSIRVLLLSSEGALGLDLSFVTHMFLLDALLNRSLEQQVVSRAYRIGARNHVEVMQLYAVETIEDILQSMRFSAIDQSENQQSSCTCVNNVKKSRKGCNSSATLKCFCQCSCSITRRGTTCETGSALTATSSALEQSSMNSCRNVGCANMESQSVKADWDGAVSEPASVIDTSSSTFGKTMSILHKLAESIALIKC